MKRMIMKNWMAALLLTGACCGMVACDDDDNGGNTPPPDPDTAIVVGDYAGRMQILLLAPTASEEEPAGTPITASVTGDEIQFKDFPIRDLVVMILGDEELADQIVGQIGAVDYAVPYTALMNEEKTTVKLTLTPEALTLTLGGEEPALAPHAEEAVEIGVSILVETEGTYTVESKKLGFALSVDGVMYGGEALPDFNPFTMNFDLTKSDK